MIVRSHKAKLILKALSRINTAILLITEYDPDEPEIIDWTDPIELLIEYETRKVTLKDQLQKQLDKFN